MIAIKYWGRLGNSLCQYGFARILSDELFQYLPPHPIVGFPITYKEINVDKKNTEKGEWLVLSKIDFWDIENLKKMMCSKKNIYLRSGCSNYNNFKNYRDKIRNDWFNITQPYNKNDLNMKNNFFIRKNKEIIPIEIKNIEKDDLFIHVRLGDVVSGKWSNRLLSFDYFDIILRNVKANRVFISSESIYHPLLEPFDKYSPIYLLNANHIETFNFIKLFDRIAISQSSYSWWAAYLSDAKEIYYPIVQKGPWSITSPNGPDLRVNEDRYIYVSQKESKIVGKFNEVKNW